MKYYLLIFLFLTGCGAQLRGGEWNPAFNEYVNRWNNIYDKQVDVNIYFQDLIAQKIVGQCDGNGSIQIDPTNWPMLSDMGKEQLIFHELGHCVLGLGHDRNIISITDNFNITYSIPESIMFPNEFGNNLYYKNNLKYYHEQLKTSDASEI